MPADFGLTRHYRVGIVVSVEKCAPTLVGAFCFAAPACGRRFSFATLSVVTIKKNQTYLPLFFGLRGLALSLVFTWLCGQESETEKPIPHPATIFEGARGFGMTPAGKGLRPHSRQNGVAEKPQGCPAAARTRPRTRPCATVSDPSRRRVNLRDSRSEPAPNRCRRTYRREPKIPMRSERPIFFFRLAALKDGLYTSGSKDEKQTQC
jgi:hypothetical protein